MHTTYKFNNTNTSDKQDETKYITKHLYEDNEFEIKKINDLLKNDEYILWLENFTARNYSFSDNDWAYSLENISMKDRKKIDDLHLLYKAIENYSNINSIYPKINEFGAYYSIKFNDVGYKIGNMFNQRNLFFCIRTNITKDLDFIDFENIKNNRYKFKPNLTNKDNQKTLIKNKKSF